MKTYVFQCGGDHGAWECTVDVELTDEEVAALRKYAERNDYLDYDAGVESVYNKVHDALVDQCVSSYYEIGEMEDIREEYAEDEEEEDEDVVADVLDAQGFMISIPYELKGV